MTGNGVAARSAAVLTWVHAAAFGLPAVPVSIFVLRRHRLPWLWDLFPMYGGPWSEARIEWHLVAALWLYFVVSAVSCVGAWLLWRGRRSGAVLVACLLPLEAIFWMGFQLPFAVLGGLLRAALIAVAWWGLPRRSESSAVPRASTILFRVGAVLLALPSLGWGAFAVIGAAHYARTGRIWGPPDMPSYRQRGFDGWIARIDPLTLMVAFAVVCALSVGAAVLLWIRATAVVGAVAAVILIAVQGVFWIGFALPWGLVAGMVAAGPIVAAQALPDPRR